MGALGDPGQASPPLPGLVSLSCKQANLSAKLCKSQEVPKKCLFFFLPPEYRAEFVLPSARLSPRTLVAQYTSAVRDSACLAIRYDDLSGPWASPRHAASAPSGLAE